MRTAMAAAAEAGIPIFDHTEEDTLAGTAAGEACMAARDLILARETGAALHLCHISAKLSLDMIRAAKAAGYEVTAETAPHYFVFDQSRATEGNFKMNPPLRTAEDAAALVEGVKDGTVDAIVTDHAPHNDFEKNAEFELAPFGMIGLETSLALVITNLVAPGIISWERAVELMAAKPREILRVERVALEPGATADLTVIDPDAAWTVDAADFLSKAVNSGFIGAELTGRATDVYVGGYATLEDGAIVE